MVKVMKRVCILYCETGTEDDSWRCRKTALSGAPLRAVAPSSASLSASVRTTRQADRTPGASFPSSGHFSAFQVCDWDAAQPMPECSTTDSQVVNASFSTTGYGLLLNPAKPAQLAHKASAKIADLPG